MLSDEKVITAVEQQDDEETPIPTIVEQSLVLAPSIIMTENKEQANLVL